MTRAEERAMIDRFIEENKDNPEKYQVIPPVGIGELSAWDDPESRKKLMSKRKKPTPYQKAS